LSAIRGGVSTTTIYPISNKEKRGPPPPWSTMGSLIFFFVKISRFLCGILHLGDSDSQVGIIICENLGFYKGRDRALSMKKKACALLRA
jgi:hypothetical protein